MWKADFALSPLPPSQLIFWGVKPKNIQDSLPFPSTSIYPHWQISLRGVNISEQIEWPWEGRRWAWLLAEFPPSNPPGKRTRWRERAEQGCRISSSLTTCIYDSPGAAHWPPQLKGPARLTVLRVPSVTHAAAPMPLACWRHTAGRLLCSKHAYLSSFTCFTGQNQLCYSQTRSCL